MVISIQRFRRLAFAGAATILFSFAGQAQTPAPSAPPSAGNNAALPSSPHGVLRATAVNPAAPAGATPAAGAGIAAGSATNPLYMVAPEDVVEVKVFQEDDMLTTARVSTEGTINFPLIGSVAVAGKTPEEAARAIRDLLAKEYLVNPQVTLTVTEYSRRRFTVLGEVQKPGEYDMPDRNTITLLEAIGDAGGYTRIADPSNIRVKRLEGDKETVIKLNAKSMANERRTVSFEVKPGDIITVGESFF